MDFVGSPLLEATGLRILSPLDGGPPPGRYNITAAPGLAPQVCSWTSPSRLFFVFVFPFALQFLLRVLPRLPAKTCPTSGQATGTAVSVDFVLATPPRWLLRSNFPVNMCVPTSISENPGLKRPQIAIGGVAKAKWHSLLACVRALKVRGRTAQFTGALFKSSGHVLP